MTPEDAYRAGAEAALNDREALTGLILGRTAPRAADAILAAGYQRVPPGFIVTPGPESGELWEAMAVRSLVGWFGAKSWETTQRTADASLVALIREDALRALRAALSPYAKEAGDGE